MSKTIIFKMIGASGVVSGARTQADKAAAIDPGCSPGLAGRREGL